MTRKPLLLLSVLALAHCAHAQLAAYGNVTVGRLSGIQKDSQPSYPLVNSIAPIGGGGGVYYDFHNVGPMRLGADLRFSDISTKQGALGYAQGTGGRVYSSLLGARGSFKTRYQALKPYVQASAGLGRTDYGHLIDSSGKPYIKSNFQYQVAAGLDLKIAPILDIRLPELTYGGLDPFGTNGHNYPLMTVSAGIVFHLPSGN
ncbi:Opacity protein [Granulicella rosea]|uniref:Opacity protein n=1 Tax=Granulicella rosea TaxID=474952 RepID=A0A239HER6_9BACT|nr:outer membrane beta-barrel protein [Granulicella rosea]SNS79840.1 Opacity protein [Granulicella rosea]